MRRSTLKVIAAVGISLAAGVGSAQAAPGGVPLELAPSAQADPVGAQPAPIVGVYPETGSAKALSCLVATLSAGAKFCI
ncbi:hypothetical protein [Nocardia crassostreae]|uniref:hypothetical protein n=1 Tax=Nocardia crassostreae TaxID=53428 RepID=UPI0008295802|nr:hypothetical protein [Nocardia crassostreae]